MRNASFGIAALASLALVAALVGTPERARACDPTSVLAEHHIDQAMVGVDQTPPVLPKPLVAEITRLEGGGCGGTCRDLVLVKLTNLATDDMSPRDRIGYRFTVVDGSGVSAPGFTVRPNTVDGSSLQLYASPDHIDVTLHVVAIDLAGNESAPETVHIDDGSLCSIGRGDRAGGPTIAIMLIALAVASARRRRARRGNDYLP